MQPSTLPPNSSRRAWPIKSLFGIWLLTTVTAGCGTSGGPTPVKIDPAEVLEKLHAQYQAATRYADAGFLVFEGRADGEPHQGVRLPYSTTFARPNRIRIHRFGAMVVSDGQLTQAAIIGVEGDSGIPNQVLQIRAPAKLNTTNLATDEILQEALASGLEEIGAPIMDLLLSARSEDFEPAQLPGLEALDDAKLDQTMCHRIATSDDTGRRVYWIDRKTWILHRLEIVSPALQAKVDPSGTMQELTCRIEFQGAQLDGPIDDQAFQFEVPSDAQLVKRFVIPNPPLPPRLGDVVDDFEFVDLQGQKVNRETLGRKIVLLDFWFTTCAPCQQSMPQLETLYEHYRDNDQVAVLAVSIDDPGVDNRTVEQTLRRWGATVPIVRDLDQHASSKFEIPGAPSLFVLDAQNKIQAFKVGISSSHDDLSQTIERLLAGHDVAEEARQGHEKLEREFQRELALASVQKDALVEILQTEILPRSQPQQFTVERLWKADHLAEPGNLLLTQNPSGEQHYFVLDGWRTVVEIDLEGNPVARHDLELPEGASVSFLRSGVDGQGRRRYLASANQQPQCHVFDEQWKPLLHFPDNEDSTVADATLTDLDGDGELDLLVGYWGVVGIHCVSLEGQLRWSNRSLENVLQVAATGPDAQGQRQLWCLSTRGTITPIDSQGQSGQEIRIANRAVSSLATADLDGDGRWETACLLAAPATLGQVETMGLDPSGSEAWRYRLPDGFLQSLVERVIPVRAADDSGGWLLPAADGSIHLLNPAGELIDRFNYGAAITGLAMTQHQGQPLLLVSSAEGLEALVLKPRR